MKPFFARILVCFFAFFFTAEMLYAQRNNAGTYIELGFGSSNAVRPYTNGYRSATIGLFHGGFAFRKMLNDKFGCKLFMGYDQITNAKDDKSLPFTSNYLRMTFQGVVDAGALLNFRDFSKRITFLVYGGFGGSHLFNDNGKSGSMLNFTAGVMPQYRLSERFRLYLDFCRVRHVYQQVTFDLNSSHNELGYDGLLVNASLGFTIYFGN